MQATKNKDFPASGGKSGDGFDEQFDFLACSHLRCGVRSIIERKESIDVGGSYCERSTLATKGVQRETLGDEE